jgi:CRISPR-associated protein Csd2
MTTLSHRYDFVFLFDVANGNPNGDPDAGNLPRLDPETNQGLVTDVCLKRKVRNYAEIAKGGDTGYAIYVQEGAILNHQHRKAYIAVMSTNVNCGQVRGPIQFSFARSVEPVVPLEISITRMAATNEAEKAKLVEGGDDERTENRTMGRKYIVPYGLYRAHGFVSAKLAERTGFSEDDLSFVWDSLRNMFEHDRSAARGEMAARKLLAFEHASALGNAQAHDLFDRVHVDRVSGEDVYPIGDKRLDNLPPARRFSDYRVTIDRDGLPDGVTIHEFL